MKKSAIYIIVFISFLLSISIGMMDYETQSLWHLLTSDLGNLVMLTVLTIFFSSILIGVGFGINYLKKQLSNSH